MEPGTSEETSETKEKPLNKAETEFIEKFGNRRTRRSSNGSLYSSDDPEKIIRGKSVPTEIKREPRSSSEKRVILHSGKAKVSLSPIAANPDSPDISTIQSRKNPNPTRVSHPVLLLQAKAETAESTSHPSILIETPQQSLVLRSSESSVESTKKEEGETPFIEILSNKSNSPQREILCITSSQEKPDNPLPLHPEDNLIRPIPRIPYGQRPRSRAERYHSILKHITEIPRVPTMNNPHYQSSQSETDIPLFQHSTHKFPRQTPSPFPSQYSPQHSISPSLSANQQQAHKSPLPIEPYVRPDSRTSTMSESVNTLSKKKLELVKQIMAELKILALTEGEDQEMEKVIKKQLRRAAEEKESKMIEKEEQEKMTLRQKREEEQRKEWNKREKQFELEREQYWARCQREVEEREREYQMRTEKQQERELDRGLNKSCEERLRKANFTVDVNENDPYGRPSASVEPEPKYPHQTFNRSLPPNPFSPISPISKPSSNSPFMEATPQKDQRVYPPLQRKQRKRETNEGVYQDNTGNLYAEASGEGYQYTNGFPPKNPSRMKGKWRFHGKTTTESEVIDDEGSRGESRGESRRMGNYDGNYDYHGNFDNHRGNIRSTNEEPLVSGSFYKIPKETIGSFDPTKNTTNAFVERLRRLRGIYGEKAVIAAIPTALSGRAKLWFDSASTDPRKMKSVEGWIEMLTETFMVDTATARGTAHKRRYDPRFDDSVLDYFFEKVDLVRATQMDIKDQELIEEISLGLPSEFRILLDDEKIKSCNLLAFSHYLEQKDIPFRKWAKKTILRNSKERLPYIVPANPYRPKSKKLQSRERSREQEAKLQAENVDRTYDKNSKPMGKKGKERNEARKEYPISEWREDAEGRMMKRPCRFCMKWHMDYDCLARPKTYTVNLSLDQMKIQSSESESSEGSSARESSEESDPSPFTYHCVYSNGIRQTNSPGKTTLSKANRHQVIELPNAFSVGSGVSYLSAEPCPVKLWIAEKPSSKEPLIEGVVDSGGPSIIQRDLVPLKYPIQRSPLNPRFEGIGQNKTDVLGFVVLPILLPNTAALSEDLRSAATIKMWTEFQVVQHVAAGVLIGRDATKGYKINICEDEGVLKFHVGDKVIKIPITDGYRHRFKQIDPRIFAAKKMVVPPDSSKWVPIKFNVPNGQTEYMVTPIRKQRKEEGSYVSCSYSIIAKETTHILFVNPSLRPIKISESEVLGQFRPFKPNTPYCYFGMTNTMAPSTPLASSGKGNTVFLSTGTQTKKDLGLNLNFELEQKNSETEIPIVKTFDSKEQTTEAQSIIDAIHPTLGLNDIDLTWETVDSKDRSNEIDPFGMEKEFKKEGPLIPKLHPEGKSPDDLEWDLNPEIPSDIKKRFRKMLRKHLEMFSGLGCVDKKFEMKIDADIKKIRRQQPYKTSPRKRQLIRSAIDKLRKLDVIEESNSPVSSPVVVVMQHGKPRFCVDLREVNSQTAADKYALPRQDYIFNALAGAIWFTALDCNKSYHQFLLDIAS